MANLMETAAEWLAERMEESAGRSVTYRRSLDSVALTATRNVTSHRVTDEEGFSTKVQTMDWTFKASDLVLGGSVVKPRRGDTIEETIAGVTTTYEVLAVSDDLPEWEPFDSAGVMLLVHTKKVS